MTQSRSRQTWLALLAGALFLAFLADDASAQRRRGGFGNMWPQLEVGSKAPDFELPILEFSTSTDGKIVGHITKQMIKLSKFRGKKSVVVFFSSYT